MTGKEAGRTHINRAIRRVGLIFSLTPQWPVAGQARPRMPTQPRLSGRRRTQRPTALMGVPVRMEHRIWKRSWAGPMSDADHVRLGRIAGEFATAGLDDGWESGR
ncbi:hypothetical protein [Micromonospora sp. NPDC007230]|uniref:hypothetical protein n=1 Tax=Micromonospora sp. NPDC007230 TaxID=3364237 RepID=UPI00368FE170